MKSKQKFYGKIFAALITLSCVGTPASAAEAAKNVVAGRQYFMRYCASCHGVDGTGNGPAAKSLAIPPADLRRLGDKYGMPLPAARLADVIDGRHTVRAHGSELLPKVVDRDGMKKAAYPSA